jgi:hypothetical protein
MEEADNAVPVLVRLIAVLGRSNGNGVQSLPVIIVAILVMLLLHLSVRLEVIVHNLEDACPTALGFSAEVPSQRRADGLPHDGKEEHPGKRGKSGRYDEGGERPKVHLDPRNGQGGLK